MKFLGITITQPENDALRQLAQATGLSVAEIVRRAIDEYLLRPTVIQQEEPPPHGHDAHHHSA